MLGFAAMAALLALPVAAQDEPVEHCPGGIVIDDLIVEIVGIERTGADLVVTWDIESRRRDEVTIVPASAGKHVAAITGNGTPASWSLAANKSAPRTSLRVGSHARGTLRFSPASPSPATDRVDVLLYFRAEPLGAITRRRGTTIIEGKWRDAAIGCVTPL